MMKNENETKRNRNKFQKRLHTLKYKASLRWKHTLCAEVDNHERFPLESIRNEKIIRFLNYERRKESKTETKQKIETIKQESLVFTWCIEAIENTPPVKKKTHKNPYAKRKKKKKTNEVKENQSNLKLKGQNH